MKDYPYAPGWRLNKENNKPAINHSILIYTTHGVAEGEWNGSEWIQYRWSCKLKDSDVLYWIHLEDLIQLEKEGDTLQQEQPKFKVGDTIHKKGENTVFPITIERISDGDYVCDGGKCFVSIKFQDAYELVEQPEVDFEKEMDKLTSLKYVCQSDDVWDMCIARHFYELGKNTRK